MHIDSRIVFIPTGKLRHIEGYSKKRVNWLVNKIQTEQIWKKPLCVARQHFLVMDGQHRMESALILQLPWVPCMVFDYFDVEVWSLRDNYEVDHHRIIERSISDNIYPYKTVKHRFPIEVPELSIPLNELIQLQVESCTSLS